MLLNILITTLCCDFRINDYKIKKKLTMEQSMNMLAIWKDLAQLTQNCFKDIQNCFEQQTLKLDVVYNDFLTSVQKDPILYAPEIKTSKRQSKAKKSNVGDLFCEPSFQPPAIPPVRRTKRQASIAAAGKMKSLRESSAISSSTRASRARAISTLMDITTMDFPKANSTFVASKKCNENVEECLSPQLFSPENQNETYIKPSNPNETYKLTNENSIKSTSQEIKQTTKKKSAISKKISSNKRSSSDSAINVESINESKQTSSSKEKKCEKNEDNNSNVEETISLHITRTKKRKIDIEEQNTINVIRVPLEKQVTPLPKPIEVNQPTILDKVNEAEKRKEKYLKSKADQTKFDEQHLKVAKQREEQFKRIEEKLKKAAEEKKIKEEKQREKELMMKERALKKQKQAELRLAEINAKRKQAEELKLMKLQQKAEAERLAKIKENETKKIEKNNPVPIKTTQSNLPKPTVPLKSKINQIKKLVASDDYGLNDISARDSSEDESGPKKPVPDWAKRGNRIVVLELQYHIDSKSRDLFFDCPKQFSLKEMFKGWNIRDRQRTSSAVWNTPIRYSEYLRKH